ncbi:hypothetical protein BTM25_39400 [Actinomadura rubteroloni]|uniref:Uncharacterized protein n=1 Tax=Actinomadura rubteroloni TaxID=1926885 RepID=A0A2P4UJU6_9ACTN|nr:hypothetical protein [Actinomadura rubteroloni]POM25296.1 hypothetical protein BTM25_39400 [Actinomadura rubteroloni]
MGGAAVIRRDGVALTASVLTHPRRAALARRLADHDAVFTLTPDPDPDGSPTALRTALAAWSSVPPEATHHLVVQDDMILADGFLDRAVRAAAALPDAALSFFTLWDSRNAGAVRLGALAGVRWAAAAGEYAPSAAVLLPRRVAAGFTAFAAGRAGAWPDDILLHQYLRRAGTARFVAVPNAVEHADPASLAGNRWRGPRRSACWLPADPAAKSEESRIEGMSALPFIKYGKALCSVRVDATRWHDVPTERYLAGLGVAVPAGPPGIEREVWLTGFALGAAARADRSAVVTGRAVPDSGVVAAALASIGPGGLCHHRSAEDIAELRAPLAAIARRGLDAGAEHRPRRAPARTGVTVVGDAPLREFVARGLRDHGRGPGGPAVVDLTSAPSGTITLTRPGRAPEVIGVGDLYGPGCPPASPFGAVVFAAAMGVPHTVTADPGALVRPLHTEDLVTALNRILGGDPAVPDPPALRLDTVVRAVREAVRPVPVTFASGASDAGTPPDGLSFGLRTYAQWLAYEYSPAFPDATP